MSQGFDRRGFFSRSAAVAAGAAAFGLARPAAAADERPAGSAKPPYKVSLAEWSLNRAIKAKELDNRDFPKAAKEWFGIDAVEWVSQLFPENGTDRGYLTELKGRCEDQGVRTLLIMIDRQGNLGDPDEAKRTEAIENHKPWVEAAKFLGGHSIRVNAASGGTFTEQIERAADGLRRLAEFADGFGIDVIVENHGGLSSNGAWLAAVMELAGHPRVGTLPDFGNFYIDRAKGVQYDKYKGVMQLMPYAKAVSAKSYDFDEQGRETTIDYRRMMGIVTGWGYDGYVGIEYEGNRLSEKDGIAATKRLLERIRDEMTSHA